MIDPLPGEIDKGEVAPVSEPKAKASGELGQPLDFIMDVYLKITVELGRTDMTVREVLGLDQGSVISLSKFAGEPLELFINDKLISRGEVVVANEKYGIRLTDIISPAEHPGQMKGSSL